MSGSWIADGPSDLKVKSSQEVRDKTDVTSVEMTFWGACGAVGNLFVVVDARQVGRASHQKDSANVSVKKATF